MNTMKKRMLVMLAAVGVVFGGIVGYQAFNAYMMQKYFSANAQPPATVTAMQASRQSWQPRLRAVGSLRAVQGVQISSEVAGMVSVVHVQSGQRVKAGDMLIELNHADDAAELRSLQADALLAKLNFKRDKGQFAAQAVSQAQLDTSKAALARSLAAVARQKALIAKKQIRAPFAGRLGIVALNPGQYVNPADAMTTLQNSEALFVDFYLPQKDIGDIAKNQRIRISSDAWPGKQFTGKIIAISSAVDSNTRNVRIEGRIDNRDGRLYPGMFASVKVENGKPAHYLTLPQTAIAYNAYGATVFIAKRQAVAKTKGAGGADSDGAGAENKSPLLAQQSFVKVGPTRGDQVAILSGIEQGDWVVTSGQMKLKNGTPLVIDNSVQPANEISPTPQEH